jgi:hypothetical protein
MSLLIKQEITSDFLNEVFGAGFYFTFIMACDPVSHQHDLGGWESVES